MFFIKYYITTQDTRRITNTSSHESTTATIEALDGLTSVDKANGRRLGAEAGRLHRVICRSDASLTASSMCGAS